MKLEDIVIGFISGIVGAFIIIFFDYLASNSRKKTKEIIKCINELRNNRDAKKFIRNKYRFSLGVALDRFINVESSKQPLIINKPESPEDKTDRYDFYSEHISKASEELFTFHSSLIRLFFWKYSKVLKFTSNLKLIVEAFDNIRQYEIDNKTSLLSYNDEYFTIINGKESNRFVRELMELINKNRNILNRI